MSDTNVQPAPEGRETESTPSAPPPSGGGNPILNLFQRPRIVLLLLTAWSLLTVLTEAANENGIFMDLHIDQIDGEIDGALGGLGLAWQGIPLALLYADSFRNPAAHQRVFWLAIAHTAAVIVANFYHLGKGDFSLESIIIPVASAGGLLFLSFVQLFQATGPTEGPPRPANAE